MITDHCAVCGSKVDIESHHFLPKALDGGDEDTNMISLCFQHHAFMHDITRPASFSSIHKARNKIYREKNYFCGGGVPFGKKIVIKDGIKCLEWDKSSNQFKALVYFFKNKSTHSYRELSPKAKELFNIKITFQQVYVIMKRNSELYPIIVERGEF